MIPVYTITAIIMLFLAFFLNYRYNPHFQNEKMVSVGVFLAILFQFIFDNLTAWRGFWVFDDAVTLGIRVPVIPVENLIFGVSLFLFTVLFWEIFSRKR